MNRRSIRSVLAEEFVTRYRHGERPPLSEYTAKHPELAKRIRQVFPLMVAMEEAAGDADVATITPQPAVEEI